jgi:hypothetical protein
MLAESSKAVTVTVPALDRDDNARAERAPATSTAKNSATTPALSSPEPPSPSSGLGGQRVAALVVGGAGVVGLAVGGYFAGRAHATYKAADCDDNNHCTDQGLADQDLAYSRAKSATIAASAGLVTLAAGVVLWITAPGAPSTDAAIAPPRNRLWVSADTLGASGTRSLTVGGVF